MTMTTDDLSGQFVLCQDTKVIPEKWNVEEVGKWLLATHPSLPVIDISTAAGAQIGWMIGYPINLECEVVTGKVIFPSYSDDREKGDIIDGFLYDFGGRFAAILVGEGLSRFYLDPSGSLAAVYSTTEPVVASTSSAMGKDRSSNDWDERLVEALPGMWYPFGLTPHKSLERILPDHYLDLSDWKLVRHWPGKSSLHVEAGVTEQIENIAALITNIVCATVSHGAYLNLTAGFDTRMMLACAKEMASEIVFFTSTQDKTDVHTARLLAKKLNLKHVLIESVPATRSQQETRLHLSGYVSDAGSLSHYENHQGRPRKDYLQLAGLAGEVGRSFYWKNGAVSHLDAKTLLGLIQIPAYGPVIRRAEDWLSKIRELNPYQKLDVAYIEQRLGCWAGPQMYAYDHLTLPVVYAFSHRRIFENMLRLPYRYRQKQQMTIDICKLKWPETLGVPFNQLTGIRRVMQRIGDFFPSRAKDALRVGRDAIARVYRHRHARRRKV